MNEKNRHEVQIFDYELLYNTFVGHISAVWLVKFTDPEKQGAQDIAYQTDL